MDAGEPLDVRSRRILLNEFVRGIQRGGEERQTLFEIGHEELPVGLAGLSKLAQDMHEVRPEICHGGKQAQDGRACADFVVEDEKAFEAAQFLRQRVGSFGRIGGGAVRGRCRDRRATFWRIRRLKGVAASFLRQIGIVVAGAVQGKKMPGI